MKYKKLTKNQIIISLDRLTRFKNTKDKYLRVFSDILTESLIEPSIKKYMISDFDYAKLADMVSEIFNASLETDNIPNDLCTNKILKTVENELFSNDEEVQKLLDNKFDYKKAVEYIGDNAPINLRWLRRIVSNTDMIKSGEMTLDTLRERYLLKYPIKKILLVEGITEEILLPVFAKFLCKDFDKKGIQIIAAGGKNQVVKMYYKLSQEIKVPIFVLLDKDAEENINQIKPRLRATDKIHLVSCGEFEDMLPHSLIVKTVNAHFKNFLSVNENDFANNLKMVSVLEDIFKTKGLHEFKKADFARLVRENIDSEADISDEIKNIIEELEL